MTNLNNVYTFGVEIEFKGVTTDAMADALTAAGIRSRRQGYGSHAIVNYWKVTTDETVSSSGYDFRTGQGTGGELVSPILKGEDGLAKLKQVLAVINGLDGLFVDRACGVHVHLGRVDGWTVNHVKSIYRRYAAFETSFDSFMPPSRRGDTNRWCGSINGYAPGVAQQRAGNLNGLTSCGGSKYKKINLGSLTRNGANLGTIEFRQHSGSTDYNKLSNWIRLLVAFCDQSTVAPVSSSVPTPGFTPSATYRPRKRNAYSEIREQVAAVGGTLTYRGGKWWILRTANGMETRYSIRQLNSLYNGSDTMRPESEWRGRDNRLHETRFIDWFHANLTAAEETISDVTEIPAPDQIFAGVDTAIVQFFTKRIAALA